MRLATTPLVLVLLFGCSASRSTAVGESESSVTDSSLDGQVRLRIVTGNISAGTMQSYDTGEGQRIFQGVKADIALVQEMNYGTVDSEGDLRRFVDTTFGQKFYFFRETGAEIPNAVVSRYPILDHGQWRDPAIPNRTLVWARIDVPGDRDLWAVSAHLATKSPEARDEGAAAIIAGLRELAPERDYVVLGGDLNTKSRSETAIGTLSQVFVTSGPYPVDAGGNDRTNASRAKPLDWVLADSDLDALATPVVLGQSTFSHGLVVDTRVYTPLSDLEPAEAGDSGATNMQHMAIVRDFLLPKPGSKPGDPDDDDSNPPPPPPTGREAHVILNEILANEPSSNTDNEFIELVNIGGEQADLSGWTLSDGVQTRHVFPAGTFLAAGESLIVRGADASSSTLALSNSGDSVTLANAGGETVDAFAYTNALSGTDGVSMVRSPARDPQGRWILRTP